MYMLHTIFLHIGIYVYFYSLQMPALVFKRWITIYFILLKPNVHSAMRNLCHSCTKGGPSPRGVN